MVENISGYFNPRLAKRISYYICRRKRYSVLNRKLRLICLIAAAQAAGQWVILKGSICWSLDLKIPVREIYEVLLQGHLFCGYPKAIESLIILREILRELKYATSGKIATTASKDIKSFKSKGVSMAKRVYGNKFEQVFRNIADLSPALAEGMISEGYGRIISRKGLDIKARELAIICVLTVTGMPRQLYSHIRGAVNVGASAVQIEAAIRQCRIFTNESSIARALRTFEKSLGKRPSGR